MDDNITILRELVSIGDAQEEAVDMAVKNADTLDRIETKVSEPVEPPVVVVPDTVTVNNFPDTQKVEVINQEEVDLKKVEQLLEKVVKILPDIKDDRPAEQLKKLSEFLFKDNSRKEVIDLLKQILEKEEPVYELPKELITKENRIKVEVDRAGSGGGSTILVSEDGSRINPATSEKQDALIGNYAIRLDDTTTANITYVGKALIGAITSDPVWQIKILDETTGIIITWADGDADFNNIWDNRASLSYV